jgi:parallel beta-helix repeat protein
MKLVRSLTALTLVLMTACGGGGGGNDDGGAPTPTRTGTLPTATVTPTPDPNATPTATSPPIVGSALFVRADVGDDGNDGRSPSQALRTIAAAIAALPGLSDGRTIVVGPGTYNERIDDIPNGTATQPTVLLADPTGASTQESPGAVILRSTGDGSMVRLTDREFVEIDGFVIRGARGGNNAGVDIRTSSNITIRNCEISDGTEQADGIGIITSSDVLLINNLIFGNGRRGVRIAGGGGGSRGVRLINNTIADNDGQGVVIGTSNAGSEATLLFNIIQDNGAAPDILVTQPSVELYSADTNLVFPGRYDPSDLPQEFDVNDDARFEDPLGGIYLLLPGSPAIDAGFDDAFPEDLLDELQAIKARTTSRTGQDDEGALDLGFHAVSVDGGPIPVARTYYVRSNGDDARASGRSPDDAFRGIGRALSVARSGDTVIVGPGAYSGRLQIGTVSIEGSPLRIVADPTGVLTGDIPDAVLVDATTVDVGFQLTGARNVILDGFTIFGARAAGVEIRSNSSNITVRNCFIDGFGRLLDGSGNGISVDDSSNVDLVNNLVAFNDGSGIQLRRTTQTRIINNTIAENGVRGIRVGSGSIGVENTLIQNNIVTFSGAVSIDLNEASAETATLSHNLVFPHEYRPFASSELPRPTDIDADPAFVAFANYRLRSDSPARNAADGATDPAIQQDLATRTTAEDETPDSDALDIGYHYPILPPPPPTPTPGGRG